MKIIFGRVQEVVDGGARVDIGEGSVRQKPMLVPINCEGIIKEGQTALVGNIDGVFTILNLY